MLVHEHLDLILALLAFVNASLSHSVTRLLIVYDLYLLLKYSKLNIRQMVVHSDLFLRVVDFVEVHGREFGVQVRPLFLVLFNWRANTA